MRTWFATVPALVLAFGGSVLGAQGSGPGAPGGQSASGAPPQVPQGMREEAIRDPATNLAAFFVTVPVDWRLQAALLPGTGCSADPFPVFRAASPDGLTQLERLPRFDWTWGDAPWLPRNTPPGCLPLQETMSGAAFLRRLASISGAEFVADVPIPADRLEPQRKNTEQLNANSAQMAARFHNAPTVWLGDTAMAKVRYRNGSVPMEALLLVILTCNHRPMRDFKRREVSVDACSATVRVVRAPSGKLDDAVQRLEPAGARPNQAWMQARMDLDSQRSQAMMQQSQANLNSQLQAQNQQFQQSQALQQQQHQQFLQQQAQRQAIHEQNLSVMQRGTDMSMQRAQQSANANHTAASDTIDYALGQQTVRDPNTGQVSKVSAGYNNTWLNDTGAVSLQNNNPNANPNGYVQGNWTLQQQVHGDGTSR